MFPVDRFVTRVCCFPEEEKIMISRQDLRSLSVTGQALLDIDEDIVEELATIIKMANMISDSQMVMFTNLDNALALHKFSHPNTPITEFRYNPAMQFFNVKIFREVVSLTIDDLKHLAAMPLA